LFYGIFKIKRLSHQVQKTAKGKGIKILQLTDGSFEYHAQSLLFSFFSTLPAEKRHGVKLVFP
jgi:hypothetical protein